MLAQPILWFKKLSLVTIPRDILLAILLYHCCSNIKAIFILRIELKIARPVYDSAFYT